MEKNRQVAYRICDELLGRGSYPLAFVDAVTRILDESVVSSVEHAEVVELVTSLQKDVGFLVTQLRSKGN